MTETIRAETGISAEVDQHGETTLSKEDLDFIRGQSGASTDNTAGVPVL